MYATTEIQDIHRKVQRYGELLHAELFKHALRRTLIEYYNEPNNLAALWLRIDEANRQATCSYVTLTIDDRE